VKFIFSHIDVDHPNGDGMALPGGEETTVVVERNTRHWLWNAVPAEFNHTKLSTFKYFY